MAFASGICALAQGKATAAAAEGLARNPAARPGIQLALILGLALIESLGAVHPGDYLRQGEVEYFQENAEALARFEPGLFSAM